MRQITRHGIYALLTRSSHILLIQKKSGPYQGLWGLPGGVAEFGESPEDTLKRELLDETAYLPVAYELLSTVSSLYEYEELGEYHTLYHVGIIYKVLDTITILNVEPNLESKWIHLNDVKLEELTPFALQMVLKLKPKDVTTWRPKNAIRAKVVAIAKHENRLLVCEVRDDYGNLKGWCPLGGGVEFTETYENALKREIFEELGTKIEILAQPFFCENIFEHHGIKGHEIILAFPVRFEDGKIYEQRRFQITEDNGSKHWVEWIDIERFQTEEAILLPPRLNELLFMQNIG